MRLHLLLILSLLWGRGKSLAAVAPSYEADALTYVNGDHRDVFLKELLEAQTDLLTLSSIQSVCSAASSEFCTSSSNLEAFERIQQIMLRRSIFQEDVFKATRVSGKAIGQKRAAFLRKAGKRRGEAQAVMDEIAALLAEIPLSQDFCGVPAE